MRTYELMEAVGSIDRGLIEEHMKKKEKLARGKRARRAFVRYGAVAAAVSILTVGVIAAVPFMVESPNVPAESSQSESEKLTEINELAPCKIEGEHLCIDDIPLTEEEGGAVSLSGYIRRPMQGVKTKSVDEETMKKFFNVSEFRIGSDELGYMKSFIIEATYEPSGEFFSVRMQLLFEDREAVYVIIDPKAVFESHINGELPTIEVNGYTVSRKARYSVYDAITKEPFKDSGYLYLKLQKDGIAMSIIGTNKHPELTELVYDYLVNAEIDFEAFK